MVYTNDYSMLDDDDNCDSNDETTYDSLATDLKEAESSDSEEESQAAVSTKDSSSGMRIYSHISEKDKKRFLKLKLTKS